MSPQVQRASEVGAPRLRRVAIVDDHPLVVAGFKSIVQSIGGHEVILAVRSGRAFTEALAQGLEVDVALIDVSMPVMDGFAVLRWLRAHRPDVPALMLSWSAEPSRVRQAMLSGARGYLDKGIEPANLRRALTDVAERGHHYTDLVIESLEGVAKEPANATSSTARLMDWSKLPAREREFLELLLDPADLTYEAIADRMGVKRGTVDYYARWFLEHFGAHSRSAIVRLALETRPKAIDGP